VRSAPFRDRLRARRNNMSYIDGYIVPVKTNRKQEYVELAKTMATLCMKMDPNGPANMKRMIWGGFSTIVEHKF
jgi:uncharacterized protein YbaA (DUF1428 family)